MKRSGMLVERFDLTLSLPRVTLLILLCLMPDDITPQRETPRE